MENEYIQKELDEINYLYRNGYVNEAIEICNKEENKSISTIRNRKLYILSKK